MVIITADHFRRRFAGFSLYISNNRNFKTGHKCNVDSANPPLIYNITCQYVGRYVRLYNSRSEKTAILELAEVQVFGCLNETNYGEDCDSNCSPACQNNQCSIINGTCFSCAPVFGPENSTCTCEHNKYGLACEFECGKCKDGQPCNSNTGECTNGCIDGYYPPLCKMICGYKKYGPACEFECGKCKDGEPCYSITGECTNGCAQGYYPPLCNMSILSEEKNSAMSIPFGNSTTANLAVDGNLYTHFPYMGVTKFSTNVYWYVDLGSPKNIHNVKIFYRDEIGSDNVVYRKRFAGFSMFISDDVKNNTGYRCPVDSSYPPLLYNIFCQYGGRYVKLYNYRADGQAILELAEVQVFGCLSSASYGLNCEKTCPLQCRDRRCNVVNGKCFTCNAGYTGDRCDKECSYGKFGDMCLNVCSEKCKDGTKCNITNGHCESGCMSNYFGFTCNETCVGVCKDRMNCNQLTGKCDNGCHYGFYGADCSQKCSGNCKNNATCNSTSGLCDHGCIAGFQRDACNQECSPGRFGAGCLEHCSKNCKKGRLCHHISGACTHGCLDGFYSENCALSCSGNCLGNKVCNSSSGICEDGCSAGWKSPRCDIECNKNEYGKYCAQRCGKCRNEVRCDKITGHCPSDCSPGYLTQLCNESCTPGYFGEDCLQKCNGNCLKMVACNVGNGYCDTGCEKGWRGAQCDEVVTQDDQSNTSQLAIGMASGAGIVILLIILVVLGLLFIRKIRNNDQRSKNEETKWSGKDGHKNKYTEGSQTDNRAGNVPEYVNLTLKADQNADKNNAGNTEYDEIRMSNFEYNAYDTIQKSD